MNLIINLYLKCFSYVALIVVISSSFSLRSYAQYSYCDSSPCQGASGNFQTSGQYWTIPELKYYFINDCDDLSQSEVESAFQAAFNSWSQAVPFTFTQVFNSNEANIKIKFATIDEMESTGARFNWIAVSFFPQQNCSGLLLLNDEYWAFSNVHPTPSGHKDLQATALHELGHILGLCHSANAETTMWVSRDPLSNWRTLHAYDIEGINEIYDRVAIKNKFVNPDASVSHGGTVNVEYQSYNTDNDPNNEKLFAFDDASNRHFEAQEQTFEQLERKFNSTIERQGGWFEDAELLSLNPNIDVQVKDATYTATYKYKTDISLDAVTEFDGVADFGSVGSIFQYESENITAPDPRTYNNTPYRFAGWKDNLTLNITREVTPESNIIYEAYYKYPNHSNDVDAYKNNSQRKFVKTPDGVMHIAYESMNFIWYEISTDGGSTWRIMNDGKPLNTDLAKDPSLDYHGNVVAIVFQEINGGYYDIRLSTFYASSNDYIFGQNTLVNNDQYDTYSSDANPVIGWGYNGKAIIVWAGAYDGPFGPIDALVYKYCAVSSTGFSIYESGSVLNSTDKSTNATVYYNEYAYSTYNFHLAWEEQTTSTTSKIYYQRLYPDGNDEIQFSDYYEASYGSGYSKNYNPAIVSQDLENLGGRREDIRLSWIGYRDTQQEELEKGNAAPTGETRVLHKHKLFSWSGLSVYGDKVVGMSQNHGDNIFNNYQAYALGWSEDNYGTVTNKYIRSHDIYPTPIRTLNTNGQQIQVNNSTQVDR